MQAAITVADIVADRSLETRVLAGKAGLSRTVSWAHTCEMPDPSRFLRANEFLMTVGMCIPQGSEAQRKLIASLDDAGLAGMTIGDELLAPRLTKALFDEADKRDFPVLATALDVPFITISRMVAFSNADSNAREVIRLSTLYQTAARRSAAEKRSGQPLNSLFDTTIQVVDDATGCVVIGTGVLGAQTGRIRPLRTVRPSILSLPDEENLDSFSILHLAQVLTIDANEIMQSALERRQVGNDLLDQVLAQQVGASEKLMQHWGSEPTGYYVVATQSTNAQQLSLALVLAGLSSVSTTSRGYQLLAVPEAEFAAVQNILCELSQPAAGSALHRELHDISGAADEAVSELHDALAHGDQWRVFKGERVSLLARSRTEQLDIINSVLGELAADSPRAEPLRTTLFTFLDNNMRWNETAEALRLHRQSVVYRLERVEEITGRSVRNTKDIAEFYLARTAWQKLYG